MMKTPREQPFGVSRLDSDTVTIHPSALGDNWLCLVRRTTLIELSAFHEMREALTELASPFDGEYDGWEAESSGDCGNSVRHYFVTLLGPRAGRPK